MDLQPLAPFDPGLGRQVGHLLERRDVLRPAVRVAAVIKRVHSDEHIAGSERLRPRQREGKEHRVTGRHVSDRDPIS